MPDGQACAVHTIQLMVNRFAGTAGVKSEDAPGCERGGCERVFPETWQPEHRVGRVTARPKELQCGLRTPEVGVVFR